MMSTSIYCDVLSERRAHFSPMHFPSAVWSALCNKLKFITSLIKFSTYGSIAYIINFAFWYQFSVFCLCGVFFILFFLLSHDSSCHYSHQLLFTASFSSIYAVYRIGQSDNTVSRDNIYVHVHMQLIRRFCSNYHRFHTLLINDICQYFCLLLSKTTIYWKFTMLCTCKTSIPD